MWFVSSSWHWWSCLSSALALLRIYTGCLRRPCVGHFSWKLSVWEVQHHFCLDASVELAPNELHREWSHVFVAGSRTHVLLPLQCSTVGMLECRLLCSGGVEHHLCLNCYCQVMRWPSCCTRFRVTSVMTPLLVLTCCCDAVDHAKSLLGLDADMLIETLSVTR